METKKALKLTELPRKKDILYARALGYILKKIGNFKRILYLGDTPMSDGSVIRNFKENREFETYGIITREEGNEIIQKKENFIFNTRWKNLYKALVKTESLGFTMDKNTVLIIDIDKTAIGARGRNDKSIDKARMDAILQITENIFGNLNRKKFFEIYDRVNTKSFFPITGDNQDIISIVSIVIYNGTVGFDMLENAKDAADFLKKSLVGININKLKQIVEETYQNVTKGNPTAFPLFRKTEFEKTISRTDFLDDNTPVEYLLSEEIMMTKEVLDIALQAKEKGALVFGVSDKPALSTIPEQGMNMPPIYEKEMKIFGKH